VEPPLLPLLRLLTEPAEPGCNSRCCPPLLPPPPPRPPPAAKASGVFFSKTTAAAAAAARPTGDAAARLETAVRRRWGKCAAVALKGGTGDRGAGEGTAEEEAEEERSVRGERKSETAVPEGVGGTYGTGTPSCTITCHPCTIRYGHKAFLRRLGYMWG